MKRSNRRIILAMLIIVLTLTAIGIFWYVSSKDSIKTDTKDELSQVDPQEVKPQEVTTIPLVDLDEQAWDVPYMKEVLTYLTSEECAGRLPGTEGNEHAVAYIQSEMAKIGLVEPEFADDYEMSFQMVSPIKQAETTMTITDGNQVKELKFGSDFAEVVGHANLLSKGSFSGTFGIIDSPFDVTKFDKIGNPDIVVYTKNAMLAYSAASLTEQMKQSEHQPKVILMENPDENSGFFVLSPYVSDPIVDENDQYLAYEISPEIVTYLKEHPEATIQASTDVQVMDVAATNVVGMIDGTGDKGVIISAHFDHLGSNFDGTANVGALDNASGTTGMLMMAKILKQYGDPAMDYYFVAFNGEEEGLLGSKAFGESGVLDADKFQVVNLDMIGSSGEYNILVCSSYDVSFDLQDDVMAIGNQLGLDVVESRIAASDHASMEESGFQSVSLVEFDTRYYHTQNDTIENSMDFESLKEILSFAFQIVYHITNSVQ